MANENDSAIVAEILNRPTWAYLDSFMKHHNRILDDSSYWSVLATIWIASGTTARLDDWIRLFRSSRRNRHKLMKKHDRQTWRTLPSIVTAHRASDYVREDLDRMIAWSLDRTVLERIWKGRPIITRAFPRDRIIAYFDRRGEREIIVLPESCAC